ncbi:MAG: hypothetical protein ACT6FC_04010 [Methanosarcinaceae archaeon]
MIIIILVAFLVFLVVFGEWRLIIAISPLIPGYLFLKYKQNRKYPDLDMQLDIKAENKNRYTRWYELTSYYSIITNEMTASKIQAAIEYHMEAQ